MKPTFARGAASAFALLALAAAMSCGDGGTEPEANVVNARLVSPFSDDAAALLELTGTIESVSAPADITVYTHPGDGVTRVLLIRETPGIMEMTLRLPSGAAPPAAKVLDVSDGQDQPRADLGAYKVEY